MSLMPYRGRFAPSPTGPLHFGSLVSALASYLDACAHRGTWLVRIEDIDGPRNVPGAAVDILATLEHFGMRAYEPPVWQSTRTARYQEAFDALVQAGVVYPCACTRKEIADSLFNTRIRNTTLAYSGTCRRGLNGKPARAWRLRVPDASTAASTETDATGGTKKAGMVQSTAGEATRNTASDTPSSTTHDVADNAAIVTFNDRWQQAQTQNLATEAGDFVIKRADGQWAYQLTVVIDDADSGITHVVRGADLLDSTARQIYLQRCLRLPTPAYLHVPVVVNEEGEKLSKQTGASALDLHDPLTTLSEAACHLGLELGATAAASLDTFYAQATAAWASRFATTPRGV
jgi:glutamyl-Q tRNA(Asp) synthetase